jgi:hypothetical protein
VLVGAAVCGVVLAGAAPKSDGPDEPGVGAALGSSFFWPKLKPPLRGVVVPLCAGAAFPKRLPPLFCAPPFAAGAPPPKRPPLEGCGVVPAPPNMLFGCSPVEAAGFAPPKSPPLEGWGVVVPLPLPNVLFCWPPPAAAFPKSPPPDEAGVLLLLPNSPPPDDGVAAPPKSDLFCCWLLLVLLLFAPADPKLKAIVSAQGLCCVLCSAGMWTCIWKMRGKWWCRCYADVEAAQSWCRAASTRSSESNFKSLNHWSQTCVQLDNSMNHCYCVSSQVLETQQLSALSATTHCISTVNILLAISSIDSTSMSE